MLRSLKQQMNYMLGRSIHTISSLKKGALDNREPYKLMAVCMCLLGLRKKNTAFLCSSSHFRALEKFYDGSYPHKEWSYDFEKGEFNTVKEAEYPRALCALP
jgi:hypothetical protein